jgi:hypothetical protein
MSTEERRDEDEAARELCREQDASMTPENVERARRALARREDGDARPRRNDW